MFGNFLPRFLAGTKIPHKHLNVRYGLKLNTRAFERRKKLNYEDFTIQMRNSNVKAAKDHG